MVDGRDGRAGGTGGAERAAPDEDRSTRPRSPRTSLTAAAVALGLLLIAAAALPEGLSPNDPGGSGRMILPAIPTAIRLALAILGAVLVVLLILLRVTVLNSEKGPKLRQRSRWRWVSLLLVGVALWATFATWRQGEITASGSDGRALPSPSPGDLATPEGASEAAREYSEPFGIAVGGLFLLVLVALTVALLLLFRKEQESVATRALERALVDELESGIEDLHAIADPRAAVIACYSRMETVAQLAGIDAADSDTPFEVLGRLLRELSVSEASARRLTELFEEAKFSTREIDEAMRLEALDALTQVRDELRHEREEVHA